jgi:hypothetical protein
LEATPPRELDEGMGERARLQRLTIFAGDDVVIVGEPYAKRKKALCPPDAMTAQLFDLGSGQDDGANSPGLIRME